MTAPEPAGRGPVSCADYRQAVVMPVESAERRDRWRQALDAYLARKARVHQLRAELAAARTAGKTIRHAQRMARPDRDPTPTERTTP